jgi:hypothetical protein
MSDKTENIEVDFSDEEIQKLVEFAVATILRCEMHGVELADLPYMIKERGEYLSQDPDVPNFVRGF